MSPPPMQQLNLFDAPTQPEVGAHRPLLMKAISLWQPWASLCVHGLKAYETRGWNTFYRGPLLIHATKTLNSAAREVLTIKDFQLAMNQMGYNANTLPLGAIVGKVDLVRTLPVEEWRTEKRRDKVNHTKWVREMLFGDYAEDEGRFAWELANPVWLPQPIPASGAQLIWKFDMTEYRHLIETAQ
ncbi:ASCH domain-containing protein [Fibrella aestuarina]|nr:ASCH domain-containing protein [Fibrella aestuarina]